MGKIVVSRATEWTNKLREYGIYVDGQKIGKIGNGDTKTFDVPNGNHTIRAKIDWCGSSEVHFTISGDEKKYFKLTGFKYSNILMPFAFVFVILSLLLRKIFHIEYASWLILPIFLLLLYYLTIGRNRYLRIVQTENW